MNNRKCVFSFDIEGIYLTGAFRFLKQLQHLRPHPQKNLKTEHKLNCSIFGSGPHPKSFQGSSPESGQIHGTVTFSIQERFSAPVLYPWERWCVVIHLTIHWNFTKDKYASYSVWLRGHSGEPYKQFLPSRCLGGAGGHYCQVDAKVVKFLNVLHLLWEP